MVKYGVISTVLAKEAFFYLVGRIPWPVVNANKGRLVGGKQGQSGTLSVMFELVFLGTSASAPSVQRGLSSALVLANEHRFMIDCGEGTQRQLLRSGLGFRKLDKILLTHGHLDHILGLGGLASTLGRWEAMEELNIYGGAFTLPRVQALMEVVFGPGQITQRGRRAEPDGGGCAV